MYNPLCVYLKLVPPPLSDFAEGAIAITLISESFPWFYFHVDFVYELSVLS